MDDKGTLAELQQVIEKYNKDDPSSWMRLEDALEKVRRELVPPQIFTMKQRLQVCQLTRLSRLLKALRAILNHNRQ